MIRFYLRLVCIPIALVTAVLLLILVYPYDDHGLRELLLPEGCPPPCFMGIQPGITRMSEIIKPADERILEVSFDTSQNSQIVNAITARTSISYGEIFLLLGGGMTNVRYQAYGRMAQPFIVAVYPELKLGVRGDSNCPISKAKYWNTPVTLIWVSRQLFLYDVAVFCPRV